MVDTRRAAAVWVLHGMSNVKRAVAYLSSALTMASPRTIHGQKPTNFALIVSYVAGCDQDAESMLHTRGKVQTARWPGIRLRPTSRCIARRYKVQAARMADAGAWRANLIKDPAAVQQVWAFAAFMIQSFSGYTMAASN